MPAATADKIKWAKPPAAAGDRAPQTDSSLRGHESGVLALALSHRGDRLASSEETGRVLLWTVGGSASKPLFVPLRALRGHGKAVRCLAWEKTGEVLASAGEDARIVMWNVAGRKPGRYGILKVLCFGHVERINTLVWAPTAADGRLAAAGQMSKIVLWRRPDGAEPDDFRPLAELNGHGRPVTRVAWSPAGDRLASVGEDERVLIWSVPGLDVRDYVLLTELTAQGVMGHEHILRGVAWCPEGNYLLTVCDGGKGYVWYVKGKDTKKYCVIALFDPLEFMITSAEWLPYIEPARKKQFIEAAEHAKEVAIQKQDAGVDEGDAPDPMDPMAFVAPKGPTKPEGPGSDRLVVAGDNGAILVYHFEELPKEHDIENDIPFEVARLYPVRELPGHTGEVHSMLWGHRGSWLLSAGSDAAIRLWNVSTKVDRPDWGLLRVLRGAEGPSEADEAMLNPPPRWTPPTALVAKSKSTPVLPALAQGRRGLWGYWPYSPLPAPPAPGPSRAVSEVTASR